MKKELRFRQEMLVRVRDFGMANQPLFPESSMGTQLFAEVSAAVAELEECLTSRVLARADAQKVKAQTRRAVYVFMKTIASTGRRVTSNETGGNPFVLPERKAVSVVLSTARAFITEATSRQEQFVRRGLPATFLADFGVLVGELEAAATSQLNSRTERRQAQAGIVLAVQKGMRAIAELDVLVPNTLRLDPARLEAWFAARHIEGVNTRPRHKAEVTPPATDATLNKAS